MHKELSLWHFSNKLPIEEIQQEQRYKSPLWIHGIEPSFKKSVANVKLNRWMLRKGSSHFVCRLCLEDLQKGGRWRPCGYSQGTQWLQLNVFYYLKLPLQPDLAVSAWGPCGNFQPWGAQGWEVWTMPPPAGYVPVAGMGLAVEQGKHILPEKYIHIWKSSFVLVKSVPRLVTGILQFQLQINLETLKSSVIVCLALAICSKNQRARFTWWLILDYEKS